MDWGIDFKFLLMNPSLLFALLTILLMCGFQERLIYWFLCVCVCVYMYYLNNVANVQIKGGGVVGMGVWRGTGWWCILVIGGARRVQLSG